MLLSVLEVDDEWGFITAETDVRAAEAIVLNSGSVDGYQSLEDVKSR